MVNLASINSLIMQCVAIAQFMLSVIMLCVIMLSVVAPFYPLNRFLSGLARTLNKLGTFMDGVCYYNLIHNCLRAPNYLRFIVFIDRQTDSQTYRWRD
jgi:hypothetical protein